MTDDEGTVMPFHAAPSMLLRLLLGLCLLALLAQGSAQAEAGANPSCLSRSATGKQAHTQLVNGCGEKVTIYYCNVARPLSNKRCGEQKVRDSVFYTHVRTLEPGERSVIYHPDVEIRVAACAGQPNPYRPDGFKSDSSGAFICPTSRAAADPKAGQARTNALGATQAQACEKARSAFVASERASAPCMCKQHKRIDGSEVHFCQATGRIDEDEAKSWDVVKDVYDWMRKAITCNPREKTCPEQWPAGAIGVRG